MTDLDVKEVNVHVQGVITEKEEQQVDPNDIFGEHENKDGEE